MEAIEANQSNLEAVPIPTVSDIIQGVLKEMPEEIQWQIGRKLWAVRYKWNIEEKGIFPLTALAFELAPPAGGA